MCYAANSENNDKCHDDGKEDTDLQAHMFLRSAINVDAMTFRRLGCFLQQLALVRRNWMPTMGTVGHVFGYPPTALRAMYLLHRRHLVAIPLSANITLFVVVARSPSYLLGSVALFTSRYTDNRLQQYGHRPLNLLEEA